MRQFWSSGGLWADCYKVGLGLLWRCLESLWSTMLGCLVSNLGLLVNKSVGFCAQEKGALV